MENEPETKISVGLFILGFIILYLIIWVIEHTFGW